VVNREGRIALRVSQGYEDQKRLLENEGVELDGTGRIDLERFLLGSDIGTGSGWVSESKRDGLGL